ncbi:MAG: hypothetical protein K2H66_05315 [Oscillospiraceae bacterium]|nr:hypothetical protein [Oscillospiraceae bacterium]
MKNFRVADKQEIVIAKDLFFKLAQEVYWHTKLAIEHADSRHEALEQLHNYLRIESCIKEECQQNKVSYKRYITEQEKIFTDLIDKKFPLADEPPESEIITHGQVPF